MQEFTVWVEKMYAYDQLRFPSLALSFDTEMTAITLYDWIRLNRGGDGDLLMSEKLDKKKDNKVDLVGVKDM